jgi:hypothetical protein
MNKKTLSQRQRENVDRRMQIIRKIKSDREFRKMCLILAFIFTALVFFIIGVLFAHDRGYDLCLNNYVETVNGIKPKRVLDIIGDPRKRGEKLSINGLITSQGGTFNMADYLPYSKSERSLGFSK